MYRTLLGRVGVASVGCAALLWVACATIPDFIVTGGGTGDAPFAPGDGGTSTDGRVPDGGTLDGASTLECADAAPPTRYVMFVTAAPFFKGNFVGDAGDIGDEADRICRFRGAKINPCTPWKALLTTQSVLIDGGMKGNALDRIDVPDSGLYQVGDAGALLFAGISLNQQSTRDAGAQPILDEKGALASSKVWVGNGPPEENCNFWRNLDSGGAIGNPSGTGIEWFAGNDLPLDCNMEAALYCVQQPP